MQDEELSIDEAIDVLLNIDRTKSKFNAAPWLICQNCGKKFKAKHSGIQFITRKKTCSKECLSKFQGDKRRKNGYIHNGYRIHKINSKAVREHRLVMEKHLGRKLSNNESVHHIDGDKLNNKISNLELRMGQHGKHIRTSDVLMLNSNDYILGCMSI